MKTLSLKTFTPIFTVNGVEHRFEKIPLKPGTVTSGNMILKLWKDHKIIKFALTHKSKQTYSLEKVHYEFSVPLRNFGKILIPDSGRFFMEKFLPRQVWSYKFESTGRALANPYFCLLNAHEKVDFGFGLLGKIYESEFHFHSPGANKKNSLTVHGGVANAKLSWSVKFPLWDMPVGELTVFEDGIFQSAGEPNWFENLREYGRIYQDIHNLKYTIQDEGFRPALCTWRIINSDNMTHDWILSTARGAKKLGMKALIFDDGWYGIGLDGKSLKGDMGDWPITIPGKFDDIRETVKEVKKIGIAPVLWFCPIGIGPYAKSKPKVEHLLTRVNQELYTCSARFHTLCVRSPEAREVMVENLLKLISYGAEGIKSDLFDYMPDDACDATCHSHDCDTTSEGLRRTFKLLFEEAMKAKPDLIYSEKNNYGNVELATDGSHVRGGDSPFDENINTHRSIYPAAYMPIVHNDYLAFSNFEEPEKLAIMLMKQITTGIPNFSINVQKISIRHAKILKAWLGFFDEHLDLYKQGDFKPQNSVMDTFQRVNDDTAFISIFATGREIKWLDRKHVFLLNTTEFDDLYLAAAQPGTYRRTLYNHCLEIMNTSEVQLPEGKIKAPSAGLAHYEKVSASS